MRCGANLAPHGLLMTCLKLQEAERAAAAARSRAEKARAEANPLNHPLVKEYFKRS